jgi:Cu-Zn family superoxide dismutase
MCLETPLSIALLAAVAGCHPARAPERANSPAAAPEEVTAAIVELYPKGRHQARGMLRFAKTDHGVVIKGHIKGLSRGTFGFGIHERGDCSAMDGKSAGGYFNPTKTTARPLGQLDDVRANTKGVVEIDRVESKLDLAGNSAIVGKAIVVQAWAYDPNVDVKEVPFVACGVVQAQ